MWYYLQLRCDCPWEGLIFTTADPSKVFVLEGNLEGAPAPLHSNDQPAFKSHRQEDVAVEKCLEGWKEAGPGQG